MLAYNVETRQYYSVAPSQGYDEKVAEEQEEEGLSEVQIFLACQIRKSDVSLWVRNSYITHVISPKVYVL